MKKIDVKGLLISLLAIPFVMAMPGPNEKAAIASVPAQDQNVQVIEMTAKKYEYSPSPIHVKNGTKVQLKITATDRDHGFKLPPLPDESSAKNAPGLVFTAPQDCWVLKKGVATTIEFVAQTPGTYTFRCCKTCGFGHRKMRGQLIVELE